MRCWLLSICLQINAKAPGRLGSCVATATACSRPTDMSEIESGCALHADQFCNTSMAWAGMCWTASTKSSGKRELPYNTPYCSLLCVPAVKGDLCCSTSIQEADRALWVCPKACAAQACRNYSSPRQHYVVIPSVSHLVISVPAASQLFRFCWGPTLVYVLPVQTCARCYACCVACVGGSLSERDG